MPASSHRRDPFLGLVLDGKYEVRSPIARGGMGRVYRAIQQPLGREVALKVLDLEQLEGKKAGGDFAQRFFNEAAACAKLTHPNTVVVYDYGKTDDEVFYIAMEMLEGRNLEEILDQEAPLEPARVKHLGLQICGSIGEAHGRGMIHRDLKPSNIMLTERGADPDFVKVLDFGLVKQESDAGLTQSGALLGTPRYIAPEQIGSSDVGPESDIYSLGACLYHCLTGRPPFDSDSKFVLLASHINVEPPSIRELQPDTTASDALQSVIMRCLSKEPADRYPTMDALVEALLATPEEAAAARSSLPGKSHGGTSRPGIAPARRPASSLDRSGVRTSEAGALPPKELDRTAAATPSSILSGSAVDGAPAISTVGGEGGEGRRAPLLVAAVVVGLVGVVGGWFLLRGDGTETEAPAGVAASPETAPVAPPEPEEPPTTQEAPGEVPSMEAAPVEAAGAMAALTRVRLESDPPGARVRRGETDLGDTPLTLPIPAGESWTLSVGRAGWETREVTVLGGQGEVAVALRRARRGRPARMTSGPTMAASTSPEATMEPETAMESAPTPMEPAEPTPRRPRTDNRDPWAQ